jgi:hypothetical protein
MAIQAFPKDGTKVVWRPPAGAEAGRPLLRVRGVAGLRLHGFTFDGENRVDDLIHLDGVGAGVRLERLELAGFNRYGVRLTGAGGTAAAPVVLRHLRFTSEARAATAGVGFDPPAAHHVHVAHCRFEGPCTAGLLLRGPAPDLEVRLTRFYDLQYGLLYARAEPPAPVRWALVNNTFARIQDGALQFEAVPPAGADAAIDLRRNLFFQVRAVALVGRAVNGQLVNDGPVDEGRLKDLFGFPAVQEQGNVRDRFANENEGYTWLAGRRDVDPLGFNKLADGQFLRYGRDSALMTAAGGQAVGVPPE